MTATASSRKNASRRWLRLLSLSIFATSTSSGLRTVQLVPGLRAADFQHPMDRDAAGARQLLKPLENAVRRGFSTIEDTYAMDNIASGVLVGPNQLPEYHEMTVEACKILNIDQVPQLYIRQSSAPNAYTLAVQGRAPFVVLTTRLLDLLEPLEVQAVIAHELGHLKCEHGLPIAVANILGSVLVPDALSGVAQSRLLRWQRAAELSCDRAALVVTQDPKAVQGVVMKLSGGSVATASRMSVEAFAAQARAYDELARRSPLGGLMRRSQEDDATHPLPILRARAIERYAASAEYNRLLAKGKPMELRAAAALQAASGPA